MLRHAWLHDPVERTRNMREEEFMKYVNICREYGKRPTKVDTVREIRSAFYEAHKGVSEDDLDVVWSVVGSKIGENAGLAQFILDYKAMESEYFFPWLAQVYTSPSSALEMAYGAGNDLYGNWVKKVPEQDRIYDFVRNDPTFVFNRERQLFVADLVSSVQDKATPRRLSKVVDLGAGWMAWARWHGFQFKPNKQTILAFDHDPMIMPDEMFGLNRPLNSLGVNYMMGDLMQAVRTDECKDADLVILGGVASYYPMSVFRQRIIMPVYYLLGQGGAFFFDLQIDCPYLMRSMKVFDWPEMRLTRNAMATIDGVEEIRGELWRGGLRFSAEYALDTYNEKPSAVMVLLTKI